MARGEEKQPRRVSSEEEPGSQPPTPRRPHRSIPTLLPKNDNTPAHPLAEQSHQVTTCAKSGALQRMLEHLSKLIRGGTDPDSTA